MGEITASKPPDGAAEAVVANANSAAAAGGETLSVFQSEVAGDDFQLSKLSSVLNGLKRGANAMRSQMTQAMGAVRSGSYQVDPLQVSRSIVCDCLMQLR